MHSPLESTASERAVREPIIVIGSVRSGTSMLAKLLSLHPDVAYLGEPRPIWMHGHAYRSHDALGREDLTPKTAAYIDGCFGRFLRESGRARFAEKTPSNCLRIPFIHALYPDCRMVHIVRDGRDVVRSIVQIARRPPRKGIVTGRLRSTPFWEWPGYLPMFFRTVWRTNVLKRPASYWGPKPPGWREWRRLPPHLMAAHQWRALVEASIRDGRQLPAENYLELRYESFVRDPERMLDEVYRFTGLPRADEPLRFAHERLDPDRARLWKSTLTAEQESEALAVLGPLLETLGYPPAAGPGAPDSRP